MERLLNVVNLLSLLSLIFVLVSVRRQRIRVEYAVSWLVAAALLFGFTFTSAPTNWIGGLLGIPGGPTVLVIMILAAFLVVFYRFTSIISDLKDNNVALAQRVAVLEYLISSLNEKEAAEEQSRAR